MSLRARLLLTIGLALAVLWSATALWMARDLDRNLQRTLDERLAMSARMVAGLLAQWNPGDATAGVAQGALIVPGSRGMACQVRSLRGEVIATTRTGRAPLSTPAPGYRDTSIDGQRWRTYTLRTPHFDITTADRIDERALLRRRVALAAGVPFLVAAIGGLAALWFGAGRALAPLADLQRALASRPPDATDPIDGSRLPGELRPLLAALNGLLDRVRRAIERERHFTNDAAHELRTPLTAIDTHLQVARMTADARTRDALGDASIGVQRMRATLEQLLMLARVEGRMPFDEGSGVTATDAIGRALDVLPRDAVARVVVSGADGGQLLATPPQLAMVAVRNLIENALRYSPAEAPIDVDVRGSRGSVRIRVADEGPGMSADELQSATLRFWRGRASTGGSGLGLTLVDAIARRFGGSLSLMARAPHGLIADLVLPTHVAPAGDADRGKVLPP